MDEGDLNKDGPWTRVRGESLSKGHALQTHRSGAALSVTLGRATMVHVFATRCRSCGRLEVQMNGHRRRVIDLGATGRRGARVVSLDASWVSGHAGSLRLISRGGGAVRIDGIAVWRTGGWDQEGSTAARR